MNVRTEFKNLTVTRQNELIENFKNAYGYRTHIDILTGDFCFDFENYLWGELTKEVA